MIISLNALLKHVSKYVYVLKMQRTRDDREGKVPRMLLVTGSPSATRSTRPWRLALDEARVVLHALKIP